MDTVNIVYSIYIFIYTVYIYIHIYIYVVCLFNIFISLQSPEILVSQGFEGLIISNPRQWAGNWPLFMGEMAPKFLGSMVKCRVPHDRRLGCSRTAWTNDLGLCGPWLSETPRLQFAMVPRICRFGASPMFGYVHVIFHVFLYTYIYIYIYIQYIVLHSTHISPQSQPSSLHVGNQSLASFQCRVLLRYLWHQMIDQHPCP